MFMNTATCRKTETRNTCYIHNEYIFMLDGRKQEYFFGT